jgi:hypothetical protein
MEIESSDCQASAAFVKASRRGLGHFIGVFPLRQGRGFLVARRLLKSSCFSLQDSDEGSARVATPAQTLSRICRYIF